MPVAKMQKILIIGDKEKEKEIIESLQKSEILEISKLKALTIETHEIVTNSTDSKTTELLSKISLIETISGIKKSFIESFVPSKTITKEETISRNFVDGEWEKELKKINELELSLSNLKNIMANTKSEISTLIKWGNLKISLDVQQKAKKSSILFGEIKEGKLETIKKEFELATKYFDIVEINQINGIAYIVVVFLNTEEKTVLDILAKNDFAKTKLPSNSSTVKEELAKLDLVLIDTVDEIKKTEEKLKSFASTLDKFKLAHDWLSIQKGEKEALSKLLNSKKHFFLSGWIISKNLDKLKNLIAKSSKEMFVFEVEKEEGEIIPTHIENPKIFKPFEVITKIFGVPSHAEIDPTQSLSLFYILFFAICLSDVAYGIILSIVSFYFLKKLTLQEGGRNILILLFLGGILSVPVGVLTGSYFAIDFATLPPSGIKEFLLSLKVIDPIKSPLTLLIGSLLLGFLQNIWGLAVGMYWKIRNKELVAGILDFGLWIFFLTALVLLLVGSSAFPALTIYGKNLSIIGAILLVLTQGRNEPTFLKKVISGLLSLYRTTAFLGDTLSYSRLLALMMTTGIIGMVVNILAALSAQSMPIVGYVLMVIILIVGHLFNIVVSVLGAFVHSMRLQLVEFFGKFYEGSGKEFKPFKRVTKYVIVE